MPTGIKQMDSEDGTGTVLRIDGSLTRIDAELLDRICADLRSQKSGTITLDLADLHFMDSESAPILLRLKDEGVEFEGVHVFIQKIIDEAERDGAGRAAEPTSGTNGASSATGNGVK